MSKEHITQPLKYPGGKHYLASKIVAIAESVPHLAYVEPFAGGLSVLLAKDPEGVSEVVNDLDGQLMDFWQTLIDPKKFKRFRRWAEVTPFSESLWKQSTRSTNANHPDQAIRAWWFFIRCRFSMAGRKKDFAVLSRTRVRRGMNEQVSAWLTAVEGLPAVHERLKRVVALNRPAIDVIKSQDGKQTLFYCDSPYVHGTRASTTEYGEFEMTDDQHQELVDTFLGIKGRAIVSGYAHKIYNVLHRKHGWKKRTFNLPNNAAGGAEKRRMTEVVWTNF